MAVEQRKLVVDRLVGALEAAIAGSRVGLRGSLAAGTADQFSDIDLCWQVPDDRFADALAALPGALPTATTRVDPDLAQIGRAHV